MRRKLEVVQDKREVVIEFHKQCEIYFFSNPEQAVKHCIGRYGGLTLEWINEQIKEADVLKKIEYRDKNYKVAYTPEVFNEVRRYLGSVFKGGEIVLALDYEDCCIIFKDDAKFMEHLRGTNLEKLSVDEAKKWVVSKIRALNESKPADNKVSIHTIKYVSDFVEQYRTWPLTSMADPFRTFYREHGVVLYYPYGNLDNLHDITKMMVVTDTVNTDNYNETIYPNILNYLLNERGGIKLLLENYNIPKKHIRYE